MKSRVKGVKYTSFLSNVSQKNPQLSKQGTAGIYGMMAAIPDAVIIEDFIKEFFSEVYKLQ